jgi:hypothetical protein
MRNYAFAALLALPAFGLVPQTAKADYYCCGQEHHRPHHVVEEFYVVGDAVVFDCDGYHCETHIRLQGDIRITAKCRNGWCEIQSLPLKNAWVLESCLRRIGYGEPYREEGYGH